MAVEPLAHLDTGGDLPAIVFIHGMTFSRQTWDPIVDRLKDRFRCLAVDLPGHGASTCLLYTSPSPRDGLLSRMPSSA